MWIWEELAIDDNKGQRPGAGHPPLSWEETIVLLRRFVILFEGQIDFFRLASGRAQGAESELKGLVKELRDMLGEDGSATP